MPNVLEIEFNEAMLNIYRRAKAEAKYNATLFLQMVVDQGGLQAARTLINSSSVSTGYTALWERGRLDLTVEAMVLRSHRYHPLFTNEELKICEDLRWSARPIILVVMNREKMDKRLVRLDTPESCERFAKNAEARGHPVLAREARRRATEIRAAHHGAELEVEREALQAVYAYEEILTHKNGKRTPASRTWQMISRHGILHAIERVVDRESDATGYLTLVEMEMTDLAFEAVVLRHPDNFSSETVERAMQRLQDWKDA